MRKLPLNSLKTFLPTTKQHSISKSQHMKSCLDPIDSDLSVFVAMAAGGYDNSITFSVSPAEWPRRKSDNGMMGRFSVCLTTWSTHDS